MPASRRQLNLDFSKDYSLGVLDPLFTFTRSTTATRWARQAAQQVTVGNPGFETAGSPLGSWTAFVAGTSTVTQVGTPVRTGSFAAALNVDASNSAASIYQSLGLVIGRRYRIELYARSEVAGASLYIGDNSVPVTYGVSGSLTTAYQKISLDFTAAGPRIDIVRNSAASNSIYIDDVVVTQLPRAYLTTAAVNEPRFDFDPKTGDAMGLLMEPGATNLLTYSADVTHANWTKLNTTVSAPGTVLCPDDTTYARKIVADAISGSHTVYQGKSVTAGLRYTWSVIVKAAEYTWLRMTEGNNVTSSAWFNLSTGTVGTVTGTGSPQAGIRDLGGGWYHCWMSLTPIASSANCQFGPSTGDGVGSFTGDGTSGLWIFCAQAEQSYVGTSYIPTTTAAVSRGNDICTTSSLDPWFNNTQGTIAIEMALRYLPIATDLIYPNGFQFASSAGEYLYHQQNPGTYPNNTSSFYTYYGGTYYASAFTGDLAYQFNKWGLTYSDGAFTSARNGTVNATQNYTVPKNLNSLKLGGNGALNGWIKRFVVLPFKVDATTLKQLTV